MVRPVLEGVMILAIMRKASLRQLGNRASSHRSARPPSPCRRWTGLVQRLLSSTTRPGKSNPTAQSQVPWRLLNSQLFRWLLTRGRPRYTIQRRHIAVVANHGEGTTDSKAGTILFSARGTAVRRIGSACLNAQGACRRNRREPDGPGAFLHAKQLWREIAEMIRFAVLAN